MHVFLLNAMNKTSFPVCRFANKIALMAKQRLSVTITEIMTVRVDVIVRDDERPHITTEQQRQSHMSAPHIT